MGIGASTKETTLHHFRDPLLAVLSEDEDFDFLGVIVAGIPQDNQTKQFIGDRIGDWLTAMHADGAVISTDSWGNSHVDFAHTMEAVGGRGIDVVGCSFVGTQAQFVVTNAYMDTIVDINKTDEGFETCVLGENSLSLQDAKKADAFLKLKMRRHT